MAAGSARARQAIRIPQVAPLIRLVAIIAALLLGSWGFDIAYTRLGRHPTAAGDLLKAVQLIVGHFPDELENADLPWTLAIARWALPLLTFWSTIALVWMQVRNPLRLTLMRRRGEHLVVAGDAGLARQMALAEVERGRRVLLWPREQGAGWIDAVVDAGAACLPAKDEALAVERLGLGKARGVLLIAADDSGNTALAARVAAEAARVRPAGDPLDVTARIDNLDLRRGVESRFDRLDRSTARIRFTSLPDIAAREMFATRPLDGFRRHGSGDRWVFVFGYSSMIERYMLRLLAGAHFRDGVKPRLIVMDPRAADHEKAFRANHPGADGLSPVVFESSPLDQAFQGAQAIADLTRRYGLPINIVVDCNDDARSLALALAIDGHYAREDAVSPPINVHLQSPADQGLGVAIFAVGGFDRLLDPEMLLQERHDMLARSIHDFYLEGRLDDGGRIGSSAAMREWEDLPESFRDDNRLVADCYALKLRDIGARLTPGSGPALRFDDRELEELARAEHDRWMTAKLATGWVFGPSRNDQARVHPDIVPYDALSEPIKDLDREQIRVMTRLLGSAGLRALRVLAIALEPGTGTDLATGLINILPFVAEHYPDRIVLLAGVIDDAASRAALLVALDRGHRIRLYASANIQSLIDALPTTERGAVCDLVRGADTIVAVPPKDDMRTILHRDAHIVLASDVSGDAGGTVITVAPDGTIRDAPWRQ